MNLPNGWQLKTLGTIAKKDYGLVDGPFGSSLPASEYTTSGVPVIRGSNLTLGEDRFKDDDFVFVSRQTADRLSRSICMANDIIFTKKGTLGQTGFVPDDHKYKEFLLSSNQMKLSVDISCAYPLFVYYYVSSPSSQEKIVRDAEATGVPKTNLAYLRTFPILLPPPTEQRAIAAILGSLDDKIELNRKTNATLEELARTLFHAWFVEFAPVRAKAAGHAPHGMDAATAALFPDSFEESLLGPVPRGWRVMALPDAIEVNPSRSLKKNEIAPYLDMQNMPTVGHRANEWILRPFGSGMRFSSGDTLVARITPCLENGKTAFVDFLEEGQIGWGSTEYIVLRPKPPLLPEYAYLLARSETFRTYLIQQMTGSTGRQRVPAESLSQFFVAVPDTDVAQCFGNIVHNLMQQIKSNDEQSRTLVTIRDTLLPKLLSGALRVKDIEATL